MESISRNIQSNINTTDMKPTVMTSSLHGRSLSTQNNKYINIKITELPAELEAPPTTTPIHLAPVPAPHSDKSSSIYSRTPSSRCRDYKNFLAGKLGKNSSSKSSSRATSTTSKKSTREFMSSMSAYPWITGTTSSGLTSSAASAVSSRRDGKSSSSSSKDREAKRGGAAPVAFPFLSGCV